MFIVSKTGAKILFRFCDIFSYPFVYYRKGLLNDVKTRRECIQEMNYEKIAEQYTDIVYRAALNYCKNKNDAEDAVQNAFVKLLQTEVEFQDEEHMKRWLIRVVINECKNLWNSFWRKKVLSIEELECEPHTFCAEEESLFEEVMKLPAKYSIVLHLYYYEGYSVKEIAEIIHLSETNIQTRLMRGRNQLKQQLKEAWK